MKYLSIFLLFLLFFSLPAIAVKEPSAVDQVKAYAAAHRSKMTVRKWHGNYWVEVDGLDPCGVGRTPEEAAREFMADAKMMDAETNAPKSKMQPFVCPSDQDCI